MISPKAITRKDASDSSVSKAIDSYYQEEKDDYYTRDKQPSQWYGSLSTELGLTGDVKKSEFTQMLEGKYKGKILRDSSFKTKSANDRLGMDLTFNAPKSISIQALVAGDDRLIKAHHEAVKESLNLLEAKAQARKKVNGKTRVENTNKIAIAMFRHDTNRNNDPHLHTHSVILNLTKRKDNAFRALHNDQLVKSIPEASQAYQTNLAKKCKDLGYDIRINDNGTFDLAHISREQIVNFSSRSKQIENALAKKGLTRETATKEQKQMANFTTKQRKRKVDKNLIQTQWSKTAKKLGIENSLLPKNILNNDKKEINNDRTKHERYRTNDKSIRKNRNRRSNRDRDRDRNNGQDVKSDSRKNKNNQPIYKRFGGSETTITNSVFKLRSGNVASVRPDGKVLLQNNKQLELYNGNANSDSSMRRNTYSGTRLNAFKNKFSFNKSKHDGSLEETKHLDEVNTLEGEKYDTQQSNTGKKTSRLNAFKNKFSFNKSKHDGSLEETKHLDEVNTLECEKYDTLQNTKTNHSKESLKDMLEYEAPTTELTQRWKIIANDTQLNLKPGKAVNEDNSAFRGDNLMTHVIEHLTDKKVDLTRQEIIREMLVKGMGEVDLKAANNLLDSFIKDGEIIKAEPLYKTAEDKSGKTAKTYQEWVSNVTNDNVSTATAEKTITKGIEQGRLLILDDKYVTKQDLKSEINILNTMKKGKGVYKSYLSKDDAIRELDSTTLNNGQKSAAELILTTKDGVVGIQGSAGVGKSYTLTQVIPKIEKKGHDVHVFAPYGSQVKSLKQDGIDAHTMAKLLNSQKLQNEINENDLIIVDEAGVIPNKDAEQLLKIAARKKAKIVLLGDTQQTKAINAGKPFDLLQDNNMGLAIIDEIKRQKEPTLKKAVEMSAKDKPKISVRTLSKSIYEIKNKKKRLDILIKKYIDIPKNERIKTLIVTGTNKDKKYIDEGIRNDLGFKDKGIQVNILKRKDMTAAELKHARYFKKNTLIESHRKTNNDLKKDELYKVIGNERHLLIVENKNGEKIKFNPSKERISTFTAESIEISKGERLRVTKTNNEIGITTGDKLIVDEVTKKHIVAKDIESNQSFLFSKSDMNHFDYDYSSTVHASQGLTVDNVLVNIDTRSRTTSKETYYVAISRARKSATVLTDNIEKLPDAIAKGSDKYSAYEMIDKHKKNTSLLNGTNLSKNKALQTKREHLEI